MIISFTVKNFKSIRDEQTLNLYAEKPNDIYCGNVAFPDKDGKIGILKTAGIYGANASGKSNLLEAFKALRRMVIFSSNWQLDSKNPYYKPFRLNKVTRSAPSVFELDFIGMDKLRYTYRVEFSEYQIESEHLDYYPTARKVNLFERKTGSSGEFEFKAGNQLKGSRRIIPCLKNNLYLSKAANNEDGPLVIKNLYRQIRSGINVIGPNELMINKQLKNDSYLKQLSMLLACADTGISAVERKKRKKSVEEEQPGFFAEIEYEPVFTHNGSEDKFSLKDESDGTKRLYDFAPLILISLPAGKTVIVDEIDNSLHPYLSEFIIKLFNDPETNPNNAQLIFAAHDISLMNQEYMRRDQFWFTDKNKEGATELYSLDEFSEARANSPFAKWYTQERFGAVPEIDFKRFKNMLIKELEQRNE